MPGPDSPSVPPPGPPVATGWTAWHPTPAALDLVELVLDGAIRCLPEGVAPTGGKIIEDAEGTPVAALAEDGSLGALRPFSHPPLRSHRLTPAQVRQRLASARPGQEPMRVPAWGTAGTSWRYPSPGR